MKNNVEMGSIHMESENINREKIADFLKQFIHDENGSYNVLSTGALLGLAMAILLMISNANNEDYSNLDQKDFESDASAMQAEEVLLGKPECVFLSQGQGILNALAGLTTLSNAEMLGVEGKNTELRFYVPRRVGTDISGNPINPYYQVGNGLAFSPAFDILEGTVICDPKAQMSDDQVLSSYITDSIDLFKYRGDSGSIVFEYADGSTVKYPTR